jgi:hypothetical protein
VVLDVAAIVDDVAQRVGAGERAGDVAEERVEPIVVMESGQLETAQSAVRGIKALSFWPFLIGLVLWAAAIYFAGARRRETVRAIAISLIAIGVVILVARRVGGNVITESLVEAESVKPAVHDVWTVLTQLLADSAVAGIVAGFLGLVWTWASGSTRAATRLRHWLAPTFRDRPLLVHGVLAGVILLLLLLGPVGAPRRLISVVILMALAFVGLELLRRQGVREFPTAAPGDAGSLRDLVGGRRSRAGGAKSREAVVDRLERLTALHEKGALTDEEYAAEKGLLLG